MKIKSKRNHINIAINLGTRAMEIALGSIPMHQPLAEPYPLWCATLNVRVIGSFSAHDSRYRSQAEQRFRQIATEFKPKLSLNLEHPRWERVRLAGRASLTNFDLIGRVGDAVRFCCQMRLDFGPRSSAKCGAPLSADARSKIQEAFQRQVMSQMAAHFGRDYFCIERPGEIQSLW